MFTELGQIAGVNCWGNLFESGEVSVNSQHKAIRAELCAMAPKRAVAYVESFELPEDEERCLIECEVRKKSYIQVSMLLHVSPEVVKRRRRAAFGKIADQINNP